VGSADRDPLMVSQQTILPQNEHLAALPQATEREDPVNVTTGVVNDSEPDDEGEEVGNRRVMEFVACHGATTLADTVHDSSATLAEIFRCFICLGKVGWCTFSCTVSIFLPNCQLGFTVNFGFLTLCCVTASGC
jgi:hypothetical protein